MFGNYPVNDDWIFARQIDAFNHGIIKLSAEIDPSFLFQGFLGYVWSRLFGYSFVSLQILTFLITVLGALFLFKTLRLLETNRKLAIFATLLYFFNPLIFTSSFSFMTDNYFVTCLIISLYFYVLSQKFPDKKRYFLLSCLFIFFSTLVRQTGVFIGVAYLLAEYIYGIKSKNLDRKQFVIHSIVLLSAVACATLLAVLWPKFGNNRILLDPNYLSKRLTLFTLSPLYFVIFMFPLYFVKNIKLTKIYISKVVILAVSVFLFVTIFKNDIFPVGNVLYIEQLHTKSDFRSNFSLFDNVIFKISLSFLISLGIFKFLSLSWDRVKIRTIKFDGISLALLVLGLLNYFVTLISSDFYDRYLLPTFVCILILFVYQFKDILVLTKPNYLVLALMIFISVALQWDYSSVSRLKYNQAEMLGKSTGLYKQVLLNGTYTNYIITKNTNDYTGLDERRSFEFKCFIQDYTLDAETDVFAGTESFMKYFEDTFVDNPRPLDAKKVSSIPRVKNNLDKLIYNSEYFSLRYSLVGKRAFVATFCKNDL